MSRWTSNWRWPGGVELGAALGDLGFNDGLRHGELLALRFEELRFHTEVDGLDQGGLTSSSV